MTYKNFKDEIKKLGLHFRVLDEVIAVGNVKRINTSSGLYINEFEAVCNVYIKERFSLYQTHRFCNLDENLQRKLFALVYLLARTPLDGRGDLCKEDKWYLKHKYMNTWSGGNYLIDRGGTVGLSLGHKTSNTLIKYKFTKYEIEELKKQINLNDFEMEKVE